MSQQRSKKGPLPPGWVAYPSRSHPGKVYFFHSETRQSVWQEGITEIFDLNQADDNVGLFDDPDEGKKIKKVLQDLTATTTYIPTPIERKTSIVDEAIVRPQSPVNSPQDESKELWNALHDSESLEPLVNHLSSLSKEDYFYDSDWQNSVPLPQAAGSRTSSTESAQSTQVTNDFVQPQMNDVTFKSSVVPENVYSGYQSHICSPLSSNNSSFDKSSDSSFHSLNSSNALSRTISPCPSLISNKHTSPQLILQSNSESLKIPSNVAVRVSPRENSESSSGSPGAQGRRRNKFELDRERSNLNDYSPRPENQRERDRSPQSDRSSNSGSSRNSEIWRHMDSLPIVDQRVPPMADRRRPGMMDLCRPPMADRGNSFLAGRLNKARSLNYPNNGNNWDQPLNFRNEPCRPPNQFIHPGEQELSNQNHHSLLGFNERDINGVRRILGNQTDNKRRPNYEHDNFHGRNNKFPEGRFGPLDYKTRNGFHGSCERSHKNFDRFPSRRADTFSQSRKRGYYAEEKGRERYSHPSSVQNRISKVQNELRSKDNEGLSRRNDAWMLSGDYPCRKKEQIQTPSPNGAFNKSPLLPTPTELCRQFSVQRPDVVQMPKLSASAQQFENDRLARKRRFSTSPEIGISPEKDESFDRKGDSSFDSKSSSLDESTELPGVSNHKEALKPPDSASCWNQREASKRVSGALGSPDEATVKKTPPPNTLASQVMESPVTFISRETSFEKDFPDLDPPTVLSLGSKTKPPTFPNKSAVAKCSDTPKPEKLTPVKRVKFKENLEELREFDEGDYVCAEDKQLMDFMNIIEEPTEKHCSNLAKTSSSKKDKSDPRTGSRGSNLAQSRLKNFQDSLRKERSRKEPSNSPMPVVFEPRAQGTDQNLGSLSCAPSETFSVAVPTSIPSCSINQEEPMEWEDIPLPQIMQQVEQARLCLSYIGMKKSASWVSDRDTAPDPSKNEFCIVLDTNILLADIPFVATLRDTQFKEFGLPIIMIPWQVIQEIDTLKDRSSVVQRKAIVAKNFLYENFSNDHPRVRGQTMTEFKENRSDTPDDNILTCARKLNEWAKVILLTNDLHLATKAKIHDVETYTKEQMEAKIKGERESDAAVKNLSAQTSSSSKTDNIIDTAICSLKTTLIDYFTNVIEKGMIKYSGEQWWIRRCVIQPPWTTVSDCLTLLDKHHFSIFEHILPTSFSKRIVKDAKTFFLQQEKGKKMDFSSVMTALKAIFEIVEFLKAESAFREDSLRIIEFLEDLKRRLMRCSPSTTDSKLDSSYLSPLPSTCPVEVLGQTNLSPVASVATANPVETPQQPMVVSLQNSSIVEKPSNVIPTRDALDKAYFHCRKWCASMCRLLKIPNNFPTDVDCVDKTAIEFKEQLPVLLQFVRELITCYQSLREAVDDGENLTAETEDIKEIGRILCEFLNDHLDFTEPVKISDEDTLGFFTMTDQQSIETKKTGYCVLDELRKLFMKCSNAFKNLSIY